MSKRMVVGLAIAWTVSLVGVSVWAQGGRIQEARGIEIHPGDAYGPVITGADIGFQRVSGDVGPGKLGGRWVVRVNGQWLETAAPMVPRRLN